MRIKGGKDTRKGMGIKEDSKEERNTTLQCADCKSQGLYRQSSD